MTRARFSRIGLFTAMAVLAGPPALAEDSGNAPAMTIPDAGKPACQLQLEAAISKISNSGPMRAVKTLLVNGAPVQEEVIEFVPPTDTRTTTRSLLPAEEQQRQLDAMKQVAPEMYEMTIKSLGPDGQPRPITTIGTETFIGTERLPFLDPERPTVPASLLGELGAFGNPSTYVAKTCSATTIAFEFDPFILGVLNRDADAPPLDFASVERERKALRAEAEKAEDRSLPPLLGTLELDSAGRPVRITRDEEVPDPKMMEQSQSLFPDTSLPKIETQGLAIVLTYDQSITIRVPK